MDCRVAICPGPRTGLLDHLIPLCDLMQMSLIVQDPWVQAAAEIFYPQVSLIVGDLEATLNRYQKIYTVESCRLYAGTFRFGQSVYRGEQLSVCGLHGNSDKCRDAYWAEQFIHEDVVLLYGEYMRRFLEEKRVLHRVKEWISVGNYRYAYYEAHRAWFDEKVSAVLPPACGRRRILYAPTWSFPSCPEANNSPLFEQLTAILTVPQEFQLIVKLHPFMYRLYPELLHMLKEQYVADNVVFLDEIPLVYPLLAHVDAYLGDYSSVGYDFLVMDRPLFFLAKGAIAQAGLFIEDVTQLYQIMARSPDRHQEVRAKMYHHAFGDPVDLQRLAERLP